jgi:flavin reductase (DIM6/NTAB) family NADH-FMN oxidoreductase RutF
LQIDPSDLDIRSNYRLLISTVVPRPIALVSTVGEDGVLNVAPFSMFMGISSNPPMLAVSIASRKGVEKDTTRNIKFTKDFVVNVVDEGLAEKMNLTSADVPPEISEFDYAGLTPAESAKVSSPLVKEAPISMECRLVEAMRVGNSPNYLAIGEVVLFHVADGLIEGPVVEVRKLKPVGRLGEFLYCNIRDIFEMPRPKLGEKEGK